MEGFILIDLIIHLIMSTQNKKQATKQTSKQSRKVNGKQTKGEAQANAKIAKLEKRCATLERLVKKHKEFAETMKATHKENVEKIKNRCNKQVNNANTALEKCKKQIKKLREKKQKKTSDASEPKEKKPRRRYKSKYTSQQNDERYRARGRVMGMKLDASTDAELKVLNQGKKGRPYKYSNRLIATICIWKKLTGKAYRTCEGAAQVTVGKENTPHYSQICRRANRMVINPEGNYLIVKEGNQATRLSIDGSGLVPAARGHWIHHKWKVKRGFIRLSIVIDIDTKQILAFSITDETVGESPQLPTLLDQALDKLGIKHDGQTKEVFLVLMGDKAYDSETNYEYCKNLGVKALIPVRVNALHHPGGDARSEEVLEQLGGEPDADPDTVNALSKEEREKNQSEWKKLYDFGMRWSVEGVFSSFKRMLGESVSAVKWANVITEISSMINIYNWMQYISEEAAKNT